MKKILLMLIALISFTEISAIQIIQRPQWNSTPYERQMINNFNMQQEQMQMQREQLQIQRQQMQNQENMNRYIRYGW